MQDNRKAQLGRKRTKTLSEAQLDLRQFNFTFQLYSIYSEFSDLSGECYSFILVKVLFFPFLFLDRWSVLYNCMGSSLVH